MKYFIAQYILVSYFLFISSVFAEKPSTHDNNREFGGLKQCENVKLSVDDLLSSLHAIAKKEEAGNVAEDEVRNELEREISEFIGQPQLAQKLLCLQEVFGKGDGEFYSVALIAFYNICSRVDPVRLLPQLAAYLEAPDISNQQRQHIYEILRLISAPGDNGQRFESWVPFLREQKSDPPLKLVEWMFDWYTPAIKVFAIIYLEDDVKSRTELFKAADAVDEWYTASSPVQDASPDRVRLLAREARKALLEIGNREEWWVQLYLAQVFEAHPELRSPAVIERLKKSDHPLVKEEVKKIEENEGD